MPQEQLKDLISREARKQTIYETNKTDHDCAGLVGFPFTSQIDKVVITLTGEDADQAKEVNNTALVD